MDDEFFRVFVEQIDSIAPPQDAVPPSRINGVCIPQKRYEKGAGRGSSNNWGLVTFVRKDGSYIPVNAALREDYADLVGRDLRMLCEAGHAITLRLEWPGYPGQGFRLRTVDWCSPPNKIILSKLATEVCKIVQKFIESMQRHEIAPEHARWRVGPGGIQVEHLRLAALEQVSAGSYQPRLFHKP